jgi:hypothetical protein
MTKVSMIFVMVAKECVAMQCKTRDPSSWINSRELGRMIQVMRDLGHDDDVSVFALDDTKQIVTAEWYIDDKGSLAFAGTEIA